MNSNSADVKSLVKTSRGILVGIFAMGTFSSLWGLGYFITGATPVGQLGPIIIFSIMALASFAYGIRFFHNYTSLKKKDIVAQEVKKRKETLLLVTVIHFLLLEFVCVLGIILAIFLQNEHAMYPFYALFNAGLAFSIPRAFWFAPFFENGQENERQ